MGRLAYAARLGIAALGAFVALIALVNLVGPHLEGPWAVPLGVGLAIALPALCFLAYRLFGSRPAMPRPPRTPGPLASTAYRARRAFRVAEFEDEGPAYFVELEDGSVLFLVGQYLEEHEPKGEARPRRFPCSEFTVHRDPDEGYVVEVTCGGSVLEPEVVAPPFGADERDEVPGDGEVLRERYDALKTERLSV